MQKEFWCGRLIEEKLGAFVYALIDPRNEEFFYVGLAGGMDGQGNVRPSDHLDEANNAASNVLLSAKLTRIRAIWAANKEVKLAVIRHSLAREEAVHVEAGIIALARVAKCNKNLTNIRDGHGGANHGLVDDGNCLDFMALPVAPIFTTKKVWLFNISNGINEGKNPFEATVGDWRIGSQHCQINDSEPQYAIGLSGGVSRVVIKISEWQDASDGRKKFEGVDISKGNIGIHLFEKDFSRVVADVGFWQRGRPIRVDLYKDKFLITYGVNGSRTGLYSG
jgi:uncharacterized protein